MNISIKARPSVSISQRPVVKGSSPLLGHGRSSGANKVPHAIASPIKEASWDVIINKPYPSISLATTPASSTPSSLPALITKEQVQELESDLAQGASMAALRRFNVNLRSLREDEWQGLLTPVFMELCYNLESFNPAFTSCLLMVQRTIGVSDYVRRDTALKNLIQPLAGEYGMHINQPQLKTHRELFSDFFASLFGYPLEQLIAKQMGKKPEAAAKMWKTFTPSVLSLNPWFLTMLGYFRTNAGVKEAMSRDIMTSGGKMDSFDEIQQASYALGYNLAIEYLADYEKTWMLDSFRDLNERILKPAGKKVDWIFLEVHAEGEAEHAAIGHDAVVSFVPQAHASILSQAMMDHDRDMAAFYNRMADMLEGNKA